MEEKMMLMMNSYQQEHANEVARRIQAEADLQIARNKIGNLEQQLSELNEPADVPADTK